MQLTDTRIETQHTLTKMSGLTIRLLLFDILLFFF